MRLNLRVAILRSGRTQREIARECEMSESRLSEIVRGWRNPRDDERRRLSHVLNRPAEELFTAREVA
jgi:transcriptional regulator with XRE-family HTH domain